MAANYADRAATVFHGTPFSQQALATALALSRDGPVVITGPTAKGSIPGVWLSAHLRRISINCGTTLIVGTDTTTMRREAAFLNQAGITAVFLNQFAAASTKNTVLTEIREGKPTIAYLHVNTLVDPANHGLLTGTGLSRIVVTDAEQCASQSPLHNPNYRGIPELVGRLGTSNVALLFSQAPAAVAADVAATFGISNAERCVHSPDAIDAVRFLKFDSALVKQEELVQRVRRIKEASVVVYAQSPEECEAVAALLGRRKDRVCLHSNLDGDTYESALAAYLAGEFRILVTESPVEFHLCRRPPEYSFLLGCPTSPENLFDRAAYTAALGDDRTFVLQSPTDSIRARVSVSKIYPNSDIAAVIVTKVSELGGTAGRTKFVDEVARSTGFGIDGVQGTLSALIEMGAVGEEGGRIFRAPTHRAEDNVLVDVKRLRRHRQNQEDRLVMVTGSKERIKSNSNAAIVLYNQDPSSVGYVKDADDVIPIQKQRLQFVLGTLSREVVEFEALVAKVFAEDRVTSDVTQESIFSAGEVRAELYHYAMRGFIRIIDLPGKNLVALTSAGVHALNHTKKRCVPSKTLLDFEKRGLCHSNRDTIVTAVKARFDQRMKTPKDWEYMPDRFLDMSYEIFDGQRPMRGAELIIACFQLEPNLTKVKTVLAKRFLRIIQGSWIPEHAWK